MSKKKRVNPNKVPIPKDSFNLQDLLTEATTYNVYLAWLLVLGAMADYYDTTTEQLLQIWHTVNKYSLTIKSYEGVSPNLKEVDRVLGRSLPHKNVSTEGIKTQGDLDKLKRRLHRNAMYAGFSIIAYPLISEKLLDEDRIKAVFDRAYARDEDVYDNLYSLSDIEAVLADEYGLLLTFEDNNTHLQQLNT